MRKNTALCLGALVLALLGGCASPARIDQMSATKISPIAANHPYKEQVIVSTVDGGSDTNPLWMSKISNDDFSAALKQSLSSAGLLAKQDAGRYDLKATLLKLEQPLVGIDMTVTAVVRYIVIERSSGKTVFDKEESTPFTATFSDAFIGMQRIKVANEGAARSNIEQFISELSANGVSSVVLK